MASLDQTDSDAAIEYKRVFTIAALIVAGVPIWLVAAVAFPAYVKGWNLARGRRIIADVRQMDDAIDRWAAETGKQEGDEINAAKAVTYMQSGSWQTSDTMRNPYVIGTVGKDQITISPTAKALLSGPDIDWGSY